MRVILKLGQVAEAKGWNAARLARRADLSGATVYNIWDGVTQDPGLLTMCKLAAVLGVEVSDLFTVDTEDAAANAPTQTMAPAIAAA